MRTLQEKYNAIQEGAFTKEQFLRDARLQLPNLITQYNGYDDAVQILKNRGMIQEINIESTKKEAVKEARLTKNSLTDYRYKPTNDMDKYPYEQILRGLRVELEGMNTHGTPTPEEYKKALTKVLKNLEKDEIFYTNQLAGRNKKVDLHDKMVDTTAKNTVDTFNGMKKVKDLKESKSPDIQELVLALLKKHPNMTWTQAVKKVKEDLKEDHTKNPNDKYVVRPCKDKKEPWAVWEGEKRVKGFATKEQAKEYADKQNKKQGLSEIGMFNDPIGYKKSEPTPQAYTKKFVKATDKRGVYVYDIFKNGKLVKTIEGGEGDANAWINNAQKKDNSQELTEKVLKEGIKNLIKKALMEEEDLERAERGAGNPYGTEEEYDFYKDFEQESQEDVAFEEEDEIYEMQGPKTDAEYKRELEDYLEDNQIYGYTDRLFDILTDPAEETVADKLADFLDDNQIYGYNRGLLAIFRDYANNNERQYIPDEEESEELPREIPGFEGTRDALDDLFESVSLKDLLD